MVNKDILFIIDYETTGIEQTDVPIEVGIMITDTDFNELDRMERLIFSDFAIKASKEYWNASKAFHGIPQKEVMIYGVPSGDVAAELLHKAEKWKPKEGRIILMSDNIQFEWRHTKWLLSQIGLDVPDVFHYCGWDTSSLSLFTDFKDPKDTAHRAISDVEGLVNELRRIARQHETENNWKKLEDFKVDDPHL